MSSDCRKRIKYAEYLHFLTCSAIIVIVQNLIKQTVLFSELSDEKVKGKQVRILCDLVTVIAERYTNIVTEQSGRLYAVLMHKSGNLPFVGTRPKGQVSRY